jgi:hypothetical protein
MGSPKKGCALAARPLLSAAINDTLALFSCGGDPIGPPTSLVGCKIGFFGDTDFYSPFLLGPVQTTTRLSLDWEVKYYVVELFLL